MSMDFIDLRTQRQRLGNRIDQAIARVVDSCRFILGPEVAESETLLAKFGQAAQCLTCASGTDALLLALMGKGIGPGDAVYVPSFTFVATAEAVALLGATPVFLDVHEHDFNMDVSSLEAAIANTRELTPRAVIAVDMFGQPADYPAINAVAKRNGLFVIGDAAQSFGATLNGHPVGSLCDITTTSFFPAKPLGCYGDGGAVLTDDVELTDVMRSLRVHGMGSDRYDNVRIGLNARFDTIQAAVLIEKLSIFPDEIEKRQAVADRYSQGLKDVAKVPTLRAGATSVWAQYTLLVDNRDAVAGSLKADGIPTAVYYPIPLPSQTGYKHFPSAPGGTPVCNALAGKVISLPMYPYLSETDQDRVIASVRKAVGG